MREDLKRERGDEMRDLQAGAAISFDSFTEKPAINVPRAMKHADDLNAIGDDTIKDEIRRVRPEL